MREYSLVKESWIGVLDANHKKTDVSLISLFEQAHNIQEVVDDNPLVVASVYRLLLVILYRALKLSGSDAWIELNESGQFPRLVVEYLASVENRFDLFSEDYPFFQTAGLTKKDKTNIKKLSPNFSTANNKTLFSHFSDDDNFFMEPSEAAKYLLVGQYFSLGGGISGGSNISPKHPNYTHAPLIGGVLTYLTGKNLFETLMLNLVPRDLSPEDKPQWENNELLGTGIYEPEGMLDYLTYKPRHVRLLPDQSGRVSHMYLTQGYSLPSDSDFRTTEPAFAYKTIDIKGKKEKKPIAVNHKRSFWRDSLSIYQRTDLSGGHQSDGRPSCFRWVAGLLAYDDITEHQIGCLVVGLENAKANPLSWVSERLPINVQLLLEGDAFKYFIEAIERSEQIASKIYIALRLYAENVLPPSPKQEDITKYVEKIDQRSNYWAVVGYEYAFLVKNISESPNQTLKSWTKVCLKEAAKNLEYALDNQLGRTTKELKAKCLAKQKLNYLLAKYKEKENNER